MRFAGQGLDGRHSTPYPRGRGRRPHGAGPLPRDGAEIWTFDRSGRYQSTQDATTGRTLLTLGYDAQGRVSSWTDATGRVTNLVRNGNSISIVAPDGRTHALTLDAQDASLRCKGLVRIQRHARGVELVDTSNPLIPSSTHDTFELNGERTTVDVDRLAGTVVVTDPLGRQTTRTLDARFRVVLAQAPGVAPVSYVWDDRDRLVSKTQGGRTTTFSWNDTDQLTQAVDPLGRTLGFQYDPVGRTTSQTLQDGRAIHFAWDAGDRLTGLVPPGRGTHGFAYDLGGLDTLSWAPQLDSGDSTPTARRYDLDKRPTVVRLPSGDSLRASYDAAGRLISVASVNDTIRYGYDGAGRLDSLERGGQSVSYSYDGFLPLSQTWTGAVTGTVSTTWNESFRPSSQTVAGATVAFAYDADGVLSQAGDLSLSRAVASGLFAGDTLGSLIHRLGRNAHGEVIADTVRNGNAILSLTAFTRDSLGRILTKADSINGTRTNWRYHYDTSGRLDSVWVNGSLSAWYGYDSNGVRATGTGIVAASVDAQDRVGYSNGISYAYDDNGQLISRSTLTETTRYHYTQQGELLSVVLASGDSISYTLDPSGRRIARSLNGVVTHRWLWDGALRPVAEVDASGNLTTRYVYGTHVNVPDYLVRDGVTYRLVTDQLGSVRLVVNVSTGAVVSSLSYDVWGNVMSSSNASFQPFGYAGGLRDDATGLTHFGAREYMPELRRWTRQPAWGTLAFSLSGRRKGTRRRPSAPAGRCRRRPRPSRRGGTRVFAVGTSGLG